MCLIAASAALQQAEWKICSKSDPISSNGKIEIHWFLGFLCENHIDLDLNRQRIEN